MRNLSLLLVCILIISPFVFAQKKVVSSINQLVTSTDAETHLSFLAADEMRGRDTGSPESLIASNYLVSQFKLAGLKPVPGSASYFQEVGLEKISSPTQIILSIGSEQFKLKEDLLMMSGASASLEGELIFVGYGTAEDFEKNDVKGKIVVALAGTSGNANPVQALLVDSPIKNKLAVSKGAIALIEVMSLPGIPWPGLVNYLSADRMVTKKENSGFPHLLMRNRDERNLTALLQENKASGSLTVEAKIPKAVPARNVAAVIQGTDATLSKEWIVFSAHYDHVGVKKNASADSIFNGTRDNAIGTVALLEAAKVFSKNPPKRSVLFLAVTGEEKGLLGSEWYANHPLIPLNQTIFNFNCDGAGYNDKTIASVIDLNRTTFDDQLRIACKTFGLELRGDPVPEQNLYERSDNLSFAIKGVPAVNFSPGVKSFDAELMKYYHQPADEVASLDMVYIEKFYRSFVYAAYLLANDATKPTWKQGDKFEEAGKKLYGK